MVDDSEASAGEGKRMLSGLAHDYELVWDLVHTPAVGLAFELPLDISYRAESGYHRVLGIGYLAFDGPAEVVVDATRDI
ncbi:uncharacterized protein TERG_08175 [Trichophyton rubrum CBS 118892]|uniref:Uncharacterized protein n=1 Tax=Trichophyton rubrum (strain ATCC MYA-4607 / CBS 118892) TaxID=559305 RepID=F2T037_TRIRC|nr:uncharacterized protein TERG_08175 [Trichophyton rubrum CBS 118892]EGD91959.2 hypothetical protein TERG_08175 [Trichophyton rubrum CBS 118892]